MAATTVAPAQPSRWWIPLLEGVLAIILGILLLMRPIAASATVVLALGLYWLVVGILELVGLLRDRTAWGWRLFMGIIGVLAGGVILSGFLGGATLQDMLGTTFAVGLAFSVVIGVMAIVYGIVALISAFRGGGLAAGIMGGLGILFGLLIIANPLAATLGLPVALGILFIAAGIFMVIAAFRLRSA
jgi:uncharacterized membrane protein HdeD (DUF308 family)